MLAADLVKVEQLVPNAVLAKAVDTYIVNDELAGSTEFHPFATPSGGSMVLTVNRYSEDSGASGRNIGDNYEASDAVNEPESFHLKPIGGSFTVDRALVRGMTDGGKAVYVTNQVRQKANATKNEFARQFIDGTGTNKTIKGLKAITTALSRVSTETINIANGATLAKAQAFLEYFNKQLANSNVEFNRIYCDRDFAATLATFKQLLNHATTTIKVGDKEFQEFLGIPVVRISGVNFNTTFDTDGVKKTFYLARMSEEDGIFCGLPVDSIVLDMQEPVENGNVIQDGYVEMITQVVPYNTEAVLRCDGVIIKDPTTLVEDEE